MHEDEDLYNGYKARRQAALDRLLNKSCDQLVNDTTAWPVLSTRYIAIGPVAITSPCEGGAKYYNEYVCLFVCLSVCPLA